MAVVPGMGSEHPQYIGVCIISSMIYQLEPVSAIWL